MSDEFIVTWSACIFCVGPQQSAGPVGSAVLTFFATGSSFLFSLPPSCLESVCLSGLFSSFLFFLLCEDTLSPYGSTQLPRSRTPSFLALHLLIWSETNKSAIARQVSAQPGLQHTSGPRPPLPPKPVHSLALGIQPPVLLPQLPFPSCAPHTCRGARYLF